MIIGLQFHYETFMLSYKLFTDYNISLISLCILLTKKVGRIVIVILLYVL